MKKTSVIILFVAFCAATLAFSALEKKCPKPCPFVSCLKVAPWDCKDDEVFVKRDGCRNCCDQCVTKKGNFVYYINVLIS